MAQKLLILTLGTTAGEVGLALKRQTAQRLTRDFYYKILYMDTSDSLKQSAKVAANEFVHLSTNAQFWENTIRDTINNANKNRLLQRILYPEVPPPPPTSNGAGNIRYSAAATLTMPAIRKAILDRVETFIYNLATEGDKHKDIAFAIVISGVGATGSGAIELLLPLALEAAEDAGILEPKIDLIILHPMPTMTEKQRLLLANAEALYAEMAATHNEPVHDRYTGRRLLLGGGGQAYTMSGLADLEETAATVLRLTMAPLSGIAQKYWDSLPNRHVLKDPQRETQLPTHLSSATPITIGLADLGQQFIQVDTARLVSHLILGPVNSSATQPAVDTLLSELNILPESDDAASYKALLGRLTAGMSQRLRSNSLTVNQLKDRKPEDVAEILRLHYHSDRSLIEQESKKQIQQQAELLFKQGVKELHAERANCITTNHSLTQLVDAYQKVIDRISALQAAPKGRVSQGWSEEDLKNLLSGLTDDRRQLFGNRTLTVSQLSDVLAKVRQQLESECNGKAVQTATKFLNDLKTECTETLRHLQTFIQKARGQYEQEPGWNTDKLHLEAQSDQPLYIPALPTEQAIAQYYNHVSIFPHEGAPQGSEDPLASFRSMLKPSIEHFFDERYDIIFEMIRKHVKQSVEKNMEHYPMLKAFESFESMGLPLLQDSLKQAFELAQALIPLNKDYATQSVEEWYVTASWKDDEAQRTLLEQAIKQISETAELIQSEDPTEIVVFYLVDGLAMPAITDLSGRCLKALLERRTMWMDYIDSSDERQSPTNQHNATRGGIPVYNGYENQKQVYKQGVIRKLYGIHSSSFEDDTFAQLDELKPQQEPTSSTNAGATSSAEQAK